MNFLFPQTLTRMQYFLRLVSLALLLWAYLMFFWLVAMGGALLADKYHLAPSRAVIVVFVVFLLVPVLMLLYRFVGLDIPRLRSMGWSPWLVFLHLVPVVGLALQVCLFAIAPSVDYSEDRPAGKQSPEVRLLIWSASIFVILILTCAGLFVYAIRTHGLSQRDLFARARTYHSSAGASKTSASQPAGGQIFISTETSNSPAPQTVESRTDAPDQPTPLKLVDSGLRVDSIFFQNSSRSSAVVNGNSVMVDEQVGKWKVTAISSNSVTFQNGDGETSIVRVK